MPCPSHKSDITMKKINSSPLSISVLLFASLTGLDKERERERERERGGGGAGGGGVCVCVCVTSCTFQFDFPLYQPL